MSKRRQRGDTVWKPPGAGFVGEAGLVVLDGAPDECFRECGDPDCQEWPDGRFADGKGMSYHLSECELEDPPDGA